MNIFYMGCGSRETPDSVLDQMFHIAKILAKKGYILRSGGSQAADTAFELGCDEEKGKKEIYLPWKNFNNNKSSLFTPNQECMELAQKFHPYWNNCSEGARLLHARNISQILGSNPISNPIPVKFILCWTASNLNGGTSQILRIAASLSIPIYNFYIPGKYDEFLNLIANKL